MKMKNAISLIVLVITILVLSILAATVIITLSNTNIIGQATKAVEASTIANMKEAVNLIYADKMVVDGANVTKEDIVEGLKKQGYTDEQIDLISIEVENGTVTVKSKGIYGIRREVGSTSTKWERIEDSIGLVANANLGTVSEVKNDFNNIYPWSNILSYNYDTVSNKVTAYYGDSNYKTDGTNGDVLTKIPEFYYKREQKQEDGKTYEYIYITEMNKAGFTKSEEFSIGRYMSSFNEDSTSLKSVSGANVATNKNIKEFRTLASKTNYTLLDYRYFVLQMLYLVEYADYDTQAVLGKGNTNYRYTQTKQSDGTYIVTDKAIISQNASNAITIALTNLNAYKVGQQIDIGTGSLGSRGSSTEKYRTITKIEAYTEDGTVKGQTITFDGSPIDIVMGSHGIWSCAQNTGSTDNLGMKSGYIGENGYSAVIYRGVENFYDNAFQFVDGINIKPTGEVYINYNKETYESDKFDGDYQKIGYTLATKEGYANTLGYDIQNPLVALTTSTTDYSKSIKDYYYASTGSHNRVGLVGGAYSNGSPAGAFYWNMNNSSSNSNLNLACRVLVCKYKINFVVMCMLFSLALAKN